jgi:hypothetical protein
MEASFHVFDHQQKATVRLQRGSQDYALLYSPAAPRDMAPTLAALGETWAIEIYIGLVGLRDFASPSIDVLDMTPHHR